MQIFSGPESLGVTEDEILCKTGTFGVNLVLDCTSNA